MIDERKREKRARIQAIVGVGAVILMLGAAVYLSQLIGDVRGQIVGQHMKLDQGINNAALDVVLEEER
jgi:Na+-transporting methylmalonyl-CoA/oxaloacetate decarboxylase gamma subunit